MFLYSGESTQRLWPQGGECFFNLSAIHGNVEKKKSYKCSNNTGKSFKIVEGTASTCATFCTHNHNPRALLSWAAGRRQTQTDSEQVTRAKQAVICQVLDRGVPMEKYRCT